MLQEERVPRAGEYQENPMNKIIMHSMCYYNQ